MARRSVDESISIVDLADESNPDFLATFITLYSRTFTDPREREDPSEWPCRMSRDVPEPQPRTHLLIALSTADHVVGGLVFEHYRGSHCGLLTYLVVEADWRKKGVARSLVNRALSTLIRTERELGAELKAVFCETANPRLVSEERGAMPACERLYAVASLGARVLDVEYVQPRLVGGAGPCSHLLLLAFDPQNDLKEPGSGRLGKSMSGRAVYDFLHEFYRALGTSDPERDENFRRMTRHLDEEVALHDPRENAVLSLKDSAVCIHFVSGCTESPEKARPYPCCPVLQSMELDLMSYGYQIQRPFGSRCASQEPHPVEIVFPERVDYLTEGRQMLLLTTRRTCRVQVMVSSTEFLVSGIHVWHVVLVPDKDEAFNEYDIIKLIHLYDGRTENTGLADKVKFRVRPGKSSECEVTVEGLLQALVDRPLEQVKDCSPKAGTIQIIAGEGATICGADLANVMVTVRTARNPHGKREYEKLVRWISSSSSEGKVLLALCGIISGIFDFAEVDEEEALDTMEPTFASQDSLVRIHRCTMVNIAREDRAMAKVKDRIGISPYLLLPHAALLHNEALLDDSEMQLSLMRNHLPVMEAVFRRTDRNVNRFYLPNVFNYVTERTLFTQGAEGRGTNERLLAVRAKLQELDGQLKAAWEQRHDRGQMWIAMLLAVFTVFGLRDVFFDIMKGTILKPYSWYVLCGIAVSVVVVLILLWGRKRSPKGSDTRGANTPVPR